MSASARPFAGRTVVVTGAARGQGRSLTLLLAGLGARLVALDLDASADFADAVIDYRSLDVSNESDWSALVSSLNGDPVHGRVNNAGVTMRSRIDDVTRGDWDR